MGGGGGRANLGKLLVGVLFSSAYMTDFYKQAIKKSQHHGGGGGGGNRPLAPLGAAPAFEVMVGEEESNFYHCLDDI